MPNSKKQKKKKPKLEWKNTCFCTSLWLKTFRNIHDPATTDIICKQCLCLCQRHSSAPWMYSIECSFMFCIFFFDTHTHKQTHLSWPQQSDKTRTRVKIHIWFKKGKQGRLFLVKDAKIREEETCMRLLKKSVSAHTRHLLLSVTVHVNCCEGGSIYLDSFDMNNSPDCWR